MQTLTQLKKTERERERGREREIFLIEMHPRVRLLLVELWGYETSA